MLNFKLTNLNAAAILVGTTLLFSACGGNQENAGGSDLSGNVQIDGSSTVYPVTEAVAEEYRAEAPNVRVTVGVSGSGSGFKKLVRGDIDIANASRSIHADEAKTAEQNGLSYVELTVAYDGLTVVVHPENDWVKEITVAELKKIWEPAAQGKITRWNQIRPEWPDQEIHLYGPGVESGTYDFFTEAIVGKARASRGDFTASEDDNVLVQGVSTDKYALGFFGHAYYEENKQKLRAVPVDNGNGPVEATVETVRNGTYEPLSRPLFIYVHSKAVERPEVVDFVNFYLNTAGELVEEIGYIPLPENVYEEQRQKFEEFVAGKEEATAKQE